MIRYILTLAFIIGIFSTMNAANRYWISNSNATWNNTANWSNTSGGSGGYTVPAASDIVYFDGVGSGDCTLDMDVTVNALIISSGVLNTITYNFTVGGTDYSTFSGGTINGNNTFNIQPTGTARATFSGTVFNPEVHVVAPQILLNGSTFNGVSYFEKTGATANASVGGNTFVGNCTIKNSGSEYFMLGNRDDDAFSNNLNMINSGSNALYLAYRESQTTIGGDLTVSVSNSATSTGISYFDATSSVTVDGNCSITTNASSTSSIHIAYEGSFSVIGTLGITNNGGANSYIYVANQDGSSVTIGGAATISNNGGKRIYIGKEGDATFNGNLKITNNGSATNADIICNSEVTSNNSYNGNVVVESINSGSDGVLFGINGGTSTLATSKTITVGGSGFSIGSLKLYNFTQTGSAAQSIVLTGTSKLYNDNSNWGGDVSFKAPDMYSKQTTYNGIATMEKTGSNFSNTSYGGNNYKGTTTIWNSSDKTCYLAYNEGNDYDGDVTFKITAAGYLYPASRSKSTIAGNLNYNANKSFALGLNDVNSWIEFDGIAAQSINNISGTYRSLLFRRLETNNPNAEITLNIRATVMYNLKLTNGNIVSTNTNLLTLNDNATVDAVSDNAYVDGPIRKIGNDAFVFPVGGTDSYGNSHYAGIGISAPSATSDKYTAKYNATSPSSSTTFDATLTKISLVEYWDLYENVGSGNIDVTLYWNNGTRSGIGVLGDLRVAHWDGALWKNEGNDATTGNATNGSITVNGISSFSPFTFGTVDNVSNPLPIDLLSFDVQKENEIVRLLWSTATEVNNDYFSIERTSDFEVIEEIATIKGSGNSNKVVNYSLLDKNPLSEGSYYRLVQYDYDGKRKQYDWKYINNGIDTNPNLTIYPNPSSDGNIILNIDGFNSDITVQVIDVFGKSCFYENYSFRDTEKGVPMSLRLASGVYFVIVRGGSIYQTKKIIIE